MMNRDTQVWSSSYAMPMVDLVACRYLALGDSYTCGASVAAELRWPTQLTRHLQALGVPMRPPTILADSGWTTAELLSAYYESGISGLFDLVSLQVGATNLERGLSLQQFERELDELLAVAVVRAGGRAHRVMVLSIPENGRDATIDNGDRADSAHTIQAFNEVIERRALAARVAYFDVNKSHHCRMTGSRRPARDASWAETYTRWVDAVWPFAADALT